MMMTSAFPAASSCNHDREMQCIKQIESVPHQAEVPLANVLVSPLDGAIWRTDPSFAAVNFMHKAFAKSGLVRPHRPRRQAPSPSDHDQKGTASDFRSGCFFRNHPYRKKKSAVAYEDADDGMWRDLMKDSIPYCGGLDGDDFDSAYTTPPATPAAAIKPTFISRECR